MTNTISRMTFESLDSALPETLNSIALAGSSFLLALGMAGDANDTAATHQLTDTVPELKKMWIFITQLRNIYPS